MNTQIRLKQIRKQLSELADQLPPRFITVVCKQNQYYAVTEQNNTMTPWAPPVDWRQGKDRLIVFAGSDSGDRALSLIRPNITIQSQGALAETVMKWAS